ncbi:ABC transporter permease [Gordonia sp. NPDC127522]|uniref:ABC transporter permease n=1 Tax=Gordonia sp. NPDC127522 TaxID=3345390 RepID=UPI003637B4D4
MTLLTAAEVTPGRSAPRRGTLMAASGATLLLLLVIAALFGPLVAGSDHLTQRHDEILAPPSGDHWFGTGRLGEDVAAQTFHGMRKSLLIGIAVAVISTALAALIGSFAGLLGGRTDGVTMWAVDVLLVLPPIVVVAVLSPGFSDGSWLLLVVAIALFQWMLPARMIRSRTLVLRESGFVRAATAMGASRARIICRHLIPNMVPLLVIDVTLTVGTAVIAEAGLSYFGFGVQPPDVSLGTLLSAGSTSAVTFPWVFVFPAAALVATVMAVGLLGEGVRLRLDEPRHER